MSKSPKPTPKHWFHRVRTILRRVRWCVMSLVLLVIGVIVYFANADLPDSVKLKVETELRAHGVDLQISRLRWRLSRGFVADDVRVGSANEETNGPRLSFHEVELKVPNAAMLHLHFNEVDSLVLNGGKLSWLLSDPGQPVVALNLTNLQARLQFLPGDQWDLNHFTAGFEGASLNLSGSVTNASAFREWKIFQGRPGPSSGTKLRERLRQVVETAKTIQFVKPPVLNVMINGDAHDEQSFKSEITVEAQGATTPWGTLNNGQLIAKLAPPATNNGAMQLELKLRADEVDTRWGGTHQLRAELHAAGEDSLTNLVHARLEILASGVDTPWLQATNAHFSAQWKHSLTNPVPEAGTVELLLTDTHSPWATADEVRLKGTLSPATNGPIHADASWGWWAQLESLALDWNCKLTEIRAEDFESKELVCNGSWHAPQVTIRHLHTEMYRGQVEGNAELDVATRRVRFALSSDFDMEKAYPFLPAPVREALQHQQITWEKPPVARASGSIILPDWDERHPDWAGKVLPTLEMEGDFAVGQATVRTLPLTSLQAHFSSTNQVWELPDLVLIRPEGAIHIAARSDFQSNNFYAKVNSGVDLKAVRGLLNGDAQGVMDWLTYTQPPVIDLELWGRWQKPESIGAKGHVTLTNFAFRGEAASSLTANLAYTNLFVLVTDARLERPDGFATVSGIGIDITNKCAYMTNGYGTLDGMAIVRCIGPKVEELIVPYHFSKPPVIYAHGVIPLTDDISMADLHFNVEGGPFDWMNFRSEHVAGQVDWVAKTMHLDLRRGEFYGGGLTGTADFDFRREIGADFKLDMTATDANLQRLEYDLASHTNLQGTLSGHLIVTEANTEDMTNSWAGSGWVQVKDGLIWSIPIFGILSPALNKISPGLGQSRATEARANFTIKKSVIHTDDLMIHSPAFRILYRGSVGFDGKVDAVTEAELGRDTPLIGSVVSAVMFPFTKIFEFKITGTLKNPKQELRYEVPRVMLKPFSYSWQALKGLWPSEPAPTTNAFPTEISPAVPAPEQPVVPAPPTPQ